MRIATTLLLLLMTLPVMAQEPPRMIGELSPTSYLGTIVNSQGAWTVDSLQKIIGLNGIAYNTTANVELLVRVGDAIYQENADCNWWVAAGTAAAPTWTATGPPAGVTLPTCSAAAIAALAIPAPPCFPQILWANAMTGSTPVAAIIDVVPVSSGVDYDHSAVWVCDVGTGYLTESDVFNMSGMASAAWNYALGMWTKKQADNDCKTGGCDPNTPEVVAYKASLGPKGWPHATIIGATPISIYAMKADGTMSATASTTLHAKAGSACHEDDRIPGTDLYGLENTISVEGTLLESYYAHCSIVFQIPPSPLPGAPAAPGAGITARLQSWARSLF